MSERIKSVLKRLWQEKADALLIWNSEENGQPGTEWLSGFSGSYSVLLITKRSQFLITDGRYGVQCRLEVADCTRHIVRGESDAFKTFKRLLKREKIRSLLFDGSAVSYSLVEELQKRFGRVTLRSRKCLLQELRLKKDREEIAHLRTAAAIACRAFAKLLPLIRTDLTEREVAHMLESLCHGEGAEGMAFPTIVASGQNGALPHAKPTDKKLKRGELITVDFGVRYKGYVSDMTRTVALGSVSPKLMRMYETVRKAQELGCKKARAGVTGEAIDAACRRYIKSKRFEKYFSHATGHGIGMEVHELPLISKRADTPLPAGAVITCEPGIYIPRVGGVRIEDALVLTKKGNINITEAVSKRLIIL